MTHVVKDYTELIGADFASVDKVLKSSGATSMVGAQQNGAWLVPGSLTSYGNVPPGQIGVTYFLEGRNVYISLTYDTRTGLVTRAVQFAIAKNWVQRTGSIAEVVAGKVLDYFSAGATSALTKKYENQGMHTALMANPAGVDIRALDSSNASAIPTSDVLTTNTQASQQQSAANQYNVPGSTSMTYNVPSTHHDSSMLMIGLACVAAALVLKGKV